MLVIATALVARSWRKIPIIANFEPMHLLWLVVTNKSLNQRMAAISEPSVAALRRAGMVELASSSRSPSQTDLTGYHDGEQEEEGKPGLSLSA